jgi:hypothetical protein
MNRATQRATREALKKVEANNDLRLADHAQNSLTGVLRA